MSLGSWLLQAMLSRARPTNIFFHMRTEARVVMRIARVLLAGLTICLRCSLCVGVLVCHALCYRRCEVIFSVLSLPLPERSRNLRDDLQSLANTIGRPRTRPAGCLFHDASMPFYFLSSLPRCGGEPTGGVAVQVVLARSSTCQIDKIGLS